MKRRVASLPLGLLLAVLAGCACYEERRTDAPVGAQPAAPPPTESLIVSGQNTQVYHFCDCRYARDIADKELLGFASPEDAEKKGRIPCAVCRPREKYEEYLRSRNRSSSPATPATPDASPRSPATP